MKVVYKKISNTEQEILVEIESENFMRYVDQAAVNLSQTLDVQGFRRGHAPKDIVERNVGSDKLYNEAVDLAVRGSIDEAIKESGIEPPKHTVYDIGVLKVAPNNPFEYKIVFVSPSFAISADYADIASKVKRGEAVAFEDKTRVEDQEIEKTLAWMAKSRKANKESESDGADTPKINDEFAKSVSNFSSLEELRNSIRGGIRQEKEIREKERVRGLILQEILSQSQSEISQKIIDNEVLRLEEEFKDNVSHMGLDLDTYLAKINKNKEDLHEGWRERAKERIEFSLILDAIADKEGIDPSNEEVEREAQKILSKYSAKEESSSKINSKDLHKYVKNVLRNQQTFEFLEKI